MSETEEKAVVKKARKRSAGRIDPAKLVADLDAMDPDIIGSEFAYWLGVLPQCPTNTIQAGGLTFGKVNERIINDPNGKQRREPVVGGLNRRVNARHIRALERLLPRLVIRFLEPPRDENPDEFGKGADYQSVDAAYVRPRKGYILTMPHPDDIARAKEEKRPPPPLYVRQRWDEPAARYMFFHLCEDQDNPHRGQYYPKTLDKTGIVWPEPLND